MKFLITRTFIIILSLVNTATAESIVETAGKWMNKEVTVCWARPSDWYKSRVIEFYSSPFEIIMQSEAHLDFSDDQKKLIKKIITKNYSLADTGIHFTGWEICNDKELADLILYRSHEEEAGSFASIGHKTKTTIVKQEDDFYVNYHKDFLIDLNEFIVLNTNFLKAKITPEEELEMTALHEFGHIAGLRHEHARKEEAKKDQNCIDLNHFKENSKSKVMVENVGKTSTEYSAYDPNSIMSYCYLNKVRYISGLSFKLQNGLVSPIKLTDKSLYTTKELDDSVEYTITPKLSKSDIHTLRCLYDLYNSEEQKNCNSNYVPNNIVKQSSINP